MPKVGKLLLTWDTCANAQSHAEYLKEEFPDKSDDERFQMACEDEDQGQSGWEFLCDDLTEAMKPNTHGGWKALVANFGWRAQHGEKTFNAATGRDLLYAILPKTDCTFKIYRYGKGFAINNAHHDSPTWAEWYYISPCKEAA